MILGYADLHRETQDGNIGVTGSHSDFGAASQNVHIGSLFRVVKPFRVLHGKVRHGVHTLTQEQFIDRNLKELSSTPHEFERGEMYFFLPREGLTLARGYIADIVSRTGSARVGHRASGVSWFADSPYDRDAEHENFRPLCPAKPRTNIIVRPGDSIAQAYFDDPRPSYVSPDELKAMIQSGAFPVERHSAQPVVEKGLVLFRGNQIYLYNGALIDPRDSSSVARAFDPQTLPTSGLNLPADSFCLTSSAERVAVPNGHIAYVSENGNDRGLRRWGIRPSVKNPGSSHPRAPYVLGALNVTFEEYSARPHQIRSGEPLSELFLQRLASPIPEDRMSSSYHGHDRPVLGRVQYT